MSVIHSAQWNAPEHVFALSTTRSGGVSKSPYDSNNVALHVGDLPEDVLENRRRLVESLNLPSMPQWLEQTHSNHCIVIEEDDHRQADASVTQQSNTVLAIMTADCLPIVLTNKEGTEIGAIHAGWRGLANGVIESTLAKMNASPADIMAWVGPAICHRCYETGEEVRQTFIDQYAFTSSAFYDSQNAIHANLPKMAELVLNHHGVTQIYQSNQCTFEARNENNTKNKYYSYRQEKQTGRIVTLIWFTGKNT